MKIRRKGLEEQLVAYMANPDRDCLGRLFNYLSVSPSRCLPIKM